MPSVQSIAITYIEFKKFLKKKTALSQEQVNYYCHNYKRYERCLKRLSAAGTSKTNKQIFRIQNHIGNSMAAARTMVLMETYRKETNPKTKSKADAPKITAHEIEEWAMQVRFFAKTEEKHVKGVITKNDKKRPILMAGPILATRAQLAADIWINGVGGNENDYSNKGLSTHKAIAEVVQFINNGYKYWTYLDLKDAYPSIRRGHLKEMTVVSDEIVDVIIPTIHSIINNTTPNEAPQPSLPQGIAASSRIMSAFVGYHFRSLAGMNVVYMSYVDDMLIGARTLEELKAATKTLVQRYKDHKTGALHFGKKEIVDLNYSDQILNFLGYAVSVDYISKEIRVRPNVISFQKYREKLLKKFQCAYDANGSSDNLETVGETYKFHWVNSFRLWKPNAYAADLLDITTMIALQDFHDSGFDVSKIAATQFFQ